MLGRLKRVIKTEEITLVTKDYPHTCGLFMLIRKESLVSMANDCLWIVDSVFVSFLSFTPTAIKTKKLNFEGLKKVEKGDLKGPTNVDVKF